MIGKYVVDKETADFWIDVYTRWNTTLHGGNYNGNAYQNIL